MFISQAFAQTAGAAAGGGNVIQTFLPLILIFVVFYFLLIRPQQKKMKMHREMLAALRRGDKVITGGGILGTIAKVENDDEVTVEIAKDVKVRVQRGTIAAVLSRTEPVAGQAANDTARKPTSLLGSLFGAKPKPAPVPVNDPEPAPEAPESTESKGEAEEKKPGN